MVSRKPRRRLASRQRKVSQPGEQKMPEKEKGNGVAFLNAKQILDSSDLSYDTVEVKEWGGNVRIRELSGSEREEFDGTISKLHRRVAVGGRKGREESDTTVEILAEKARIRLCFLTIVNESGERLFKTESQLAALGRKSSKALGRIYDASAKLSGLGADAVEEAADFSEADPDESSSSA